MRSVDPRQSLALVMPAFNEEAAIEIAAREADAGLASLGIPYEILIVDDGSLDATAQVVDRLNLPCVRLIQHLKNQGYGAALRTGFEAAQTDWVAFTDADGQFHIEDLALLLEKTADHPIVVGFRQKRQDPWRRRFYSWGYNKLIRLMLKTGIRDCDCALKLFRRDVLMNLLPTTKGFFVNAEMICKARALGIPIAEAGVRHRSRRQGESKVSLMDIPRTLRQLIPFWWNLHRPTVRPALDSSPIISLGYPSLKTPLQSPRPRQSPDRRAA